MRSFAKPIFLGFAKSSFMHFSTSIKMPKTRFLNHFAHLLTRLSIFHYKKFKACESFGACIKLLLHSLSLLTPLPHTWNLNTKFSSLRLQKNHKLWVKLQNVSIPMHFQILLKVFSFLFTMLNSTFKPLCPMFWLNTRFPP